MENKANDTTGTENTQAACTNCGHTGDHDDNGGFCKVCGLSATVPAQYVAKCDECKQDLRRVATVREAAAGGRCGISLGANHCNGTGDRGSRKSTKRIVFSHDKNGKKIAFRVGYGMRLFRIALDVADYMLASGTGIDESNGWKNHFASLRAAKARRDAPRTRRCDISHDSDAAAFACGCYE